MFLFIVFAQLFYKVIAVFSISRTDSPTNMRKKPKLELELDQS